LQGKEANNVVRGVQAHARQTTPTSEQTITECSRTAATQVWSPSKPRYLSKIVYLVGYAWLSANFALNFIGFAAGFFFGQHFAASS